MGPHARADAQRSHRFHLPRLAGTARACGADWRQAVPDGAEPRPWLGARALRRPPAPGGRLCERRAARGRPGRGGLAAPGGSSRSRATELAVRHVGLNPKYTFEQFVICDGNRFAHAAALAVAELPGQAYNPLVLHGPPGLGKTHLLHAIGNYIARFGDGLTVRYATVETFTSEFVGAVRSEGAAGFKSRFRGADVLLIDDIQFLAAKQRTEEEFFHTFNALYETGRQLVFTSDRPPSE